MTASAPMARNGAETGLGAVEGTAPPNDLTLMSIQGKTADKVWTQTEWEFLCRHLHNGNGDRQFVMAWRRDGAKHYAKSSKVPVKRAMPWAWRTITDQVEPSKRVAFVPYSQNPESLSRWGCLDFDAHDGNHERAMRYAFAAFQFLLNSGLTVILEHTGGGWHTWCIAQEFREARTWAMFLRGVAKVIEAPIQPGICEIFPDDGKAKGVRAPGSWNPATDALNAIFWENTSPLLKSLRSPIGEVKKSPEEHFPDKESNIYGEVGLYPAWENDWKNRFAITSKGSRHQQLLGLVGEMFHQIGRSLAAKIVEIHYRQSTAKVRATPEEHASEFNAMWDGLRADWVASLSPDERNIYDQLKSENERDGFRIIKSFQRKANDDGAHDFPIARDNFAMRLGVTPKGGGWIRDRLMRAGAIERTAHYIQYRKAARYRWRLREQSKSEAAP